MWVRLDSDCGYEVSEGFEFGVDGWLFVGCGFKFCTNQCDEFCGDGDRCNGLLGGAAAALVVVNIL